MDYPDGVTPLDPEELGGLKFKHIETRTQLDQMEQVNIQDGLIWLTKHPNSDIENTIIAQPLSTSSKPTHS